MLMGRIELCVKITIAGLAFVSIITDAFQELANKKPISDPVCESWIHGIHGKPRIYIVYEYGKASQ